MEKETSRQFRVGLFVIAGMVLLMLSLYLIGTNQDLFGAKIRLTLSFRNINGLQPGDNVRFSGTDAGTVESIKIISDTSVEVVIILKEEYSNFIRTDAIASISTDGLMGNKLINIINPARSTMPTVDDGGVIRSEQPVATDEMLRTLSFTNNYVSEIAFNLKNITDTISNSRGVLWELLTDTSLSLQLNATFGNLRTASHKVVETTTTLELIIQNINNKKGVVGTLLSDTSFAGQLHGILNSLDTTGKQTSQASNELLTMVNDVSLGKGALGLVLRDSAFSSDLKESLSNLKQSTENLNTTIEALKKIPALRKYIKDK